MRADGWCAAIPRESLSIMVVDLTSGEVVTTSLPVSGADTDIDQQMAWTPRGQRLLAGADNRGVIIDDPGRR